VAEKKQKGTQLKYVVLTGIFVIIASVMSSPHWFSLFFPEQYKEQEKMESSKIEKDHLKDSDKVIPNGKDESVGVESIRIKDIQLTPLDFDIPSYLYIEIKNEGTKDIRNLKITIELGKSSVEEFEYFPNNEIVLLSDTLDKNLIKLKKYVFAENESVYIYALINQPIFKRILIDGDNIKYAKEYSYVNYLNSENGDVSKNVGWSVLLGFLGVIFILMIGALIFFLLRVIYTKLKIQYNWN